MKAFLFPGQGSQFIGMGKALAQEMPIAKQVFEEVDEALNESLSSIIWDGEIKDLTLTKNAQPSIMAVSIAIFRVLVAKGMMLDKISMLAGHSLGEYSALCASGVFSLTDTAKILRKRGLAMQKAVPEGRGAMVAILGLTAEVVGSLIIKGGFDPATVQLANDNDPTQVVISGESGAVEKFALYLKQNGAKKVLKLPVSAPFHSPLMEPAALEMKKTLKQIVFSKLKIPIISNVRLKIFRDTSGLEESLIEQVTGTVRWRESLIHMHSNNNIDTFYEIGPGKVLSGTVKRTLGIKRVLSVLETGEIDIAIEEINA
jgi:[acyl-carrier-protein] S-malonyltransferase